MANLWKRVGRYVLPTPHHTRHVMKLSQQIQGKVPRETLRAVRLEERRASLVTAKRKEAFLSPRWKRLNRLVAKASLAVEKAWRHEAGTHTDDPSACAPPVT